MARKSSKKHDKKTNPDNKKTTSDKEISQNDGAIPSAEDEEKHHAKKDEKSELIEWQEKAAELNDKFLRLYSEFDNYRKRTAREKIDMSKTASENLIADLLPVLDDFERAIKSTMEIANCDAVREGMNLIFNKFTGILEKKGLSPIDAIGKDFDTDFHEAITFIPAPSDDMKGKVVDELEKGYMLGEKVIRYSKVVLGKNE